MAKSKKSAAKPTRKKPPARKAKPKTKAKPAKPKTKPKPKAKAKPATKPKAAAKRAKPDQIDFMRMDGMRVASHEERDAAAADASTSAAFEHVKRAVIDAFRRFYPQEPPESDDTILATDPNEFDVDPGPFYEHLEAHFKVPGDPEQDYFGGYGGSIRDTVVFLVPRWTGKPT